MDNFEDTSPADLGWYATELINQMWERFCFAETPDEHLAAIADIVFHARHFTPEDHAKVARALKNPPPKPRGRPKTALQDDCESYVWMIGYRSQHRQHRLRLITDLAQRHSTSKEVVRRALRAAEIKRKAIWGGT